jgi:YidC/Oxa1 family membrane protein insertase
MVLSQVAGRGETNHTMDLAHHMALLAFTGPNIPIWSQYVHLLVLALDGLATIFHSAGVAIIAFTIIVKTIMLPLTVKSIRSSKAMQDLQPKIKELQKKHGTDRQRISQETMALYQQYQVNPMAGCLPMVFQIPIFLGLYQSITTLSNTGVGYWDQSFLWLPSLDHPDPWKILPIAAGLFQFVQTQMMRPKDQQKSTDPQQAMMNSVMNIMPLTVVFFGWTFAAGPVLYWATQSVYSVVQQWFITGWGSFHKWAPFLPELPEHKRLGYRPPRNLDDVVVMSNVEPVYGPGPMGWMQRKMAEAQKQAMERTGAPPAEASASTANVVEAEVVPAANKGGAKGKGKQGGNAKASNARTNGANRSENGSGGVPSGAVIVQRKAKPADGNSG